jgi:hypothetical protein
MSIIMIEVINIFNVIGKQILSSHWMQKLLKLCPLFLNIKNTFMKTSSYFIIPHEDNTSAAIKGLKIKQFSKHFVNIYNVRAY